MKFSIITIFPDLIRSYTEESILGRAQADGHIKVDVIDPRDFAEDKHNSVDAPPYGGGPGMVMQAEPIIRAVDSVDYDPESVGVIIFSATGDQFTNEGARDLTERYDHIIMICGRYEGVDERIKQMLCGTIGCERLHEVSVGPYVLTGGELPALTVIDATARQISGVLGNESSREEERVLGAPTYTRPETIHYNDQDYSVPDVLMSGHHARIEGWREDKAKEE
jgi:tRNA (guanine37-N1)-methyltransferase